MAAITENVLVISTDNTRFHVAPADTILTHFGVFPGNVANFRTQLAMFDDTGQPLGVDDEGTNLRRSDEATVSTQHLIDRITLALAIMQVRVNDDPDNDQPDFRVPIIQGDLPVVLAGLAAGFAPLTEDDDDGGDLHRHSQHPHFS